MAMTNKTSPKFTLNKWLLLLLTTLAFAISGYQRWLQQDWLTLGSVLAAWLLVIWLIQRHRRRDTAVLAAEITSLQAQLQLDGGTLRIGKECWPLQAISQVEMGVIDQQRAYVYLTIEHDAPLPAEKRRFLIPYTEYQSIRQQLTVALPQARWLLPQD